MKKVLFVILASLLFMIPVCAEDNSYDGNFSLSQNTANNYITKMADYYLFLVTSDLSQKYVYNGSSFSELTGFTNAGMLNKFEFATSVDAKGLTYLNDGQKYWTLTTGEQTSSHYYINMSGPVSSADTSLYGTRPTQYIQEDTTITGKGTFTEPWEFAPKSSSFTITIKDSNTTGSYFSTVSYAIGYNEDADVAISMPTGRVVNTSSTLTCSPSIDATSELSNSNKTIKISLKNIKKSATCTVNTSAQTFTVTANSNNTSYGTVTSDSNVFEYNTNAVFTISPKSNYVYSSNTCGGIVSGSTMTIYNITSDKTCTVTFVKAPITVTLNPNGGSCTASSMIVYYGNTYSGLPTAAQTTRTNYTFMGWYNAASGGTRVYDTTTVAKTGAHTLYAQWTPNSRTFNIRHYVRNTSGGWSLSLTTSETVNSGTSITLANYKSSSYTSGYTYYSYGTYQSSSSASATTTASATITTTGAYINLYYERYTYTISVYAQSGISSVSGGGSYYGGATASINATPNLKYRVYYFYNTTLGTTSYNTSYSVTVSKNMTIYAYGTKCAASGYDCSHGYWDGSQCYYAATPGDEYCDCVCGYGSVKTSATGYWYDLSYPICGYHASKNSSGCDTSGARFLYVSYSSNGYPHYQEWVYKYYNGYSSSYGNDHWYQWEWQSVGSRNWQSASSCGCSVDRGTCSGGGYTCPYGGSPSGSTCYLNGTPVIPNYC